MRIAGEDEMADADLLEYSMRRSATSSMCEPTSAVPAPPRTRPTPAHRFGAISNRSGAAAVQFGHATLSLGLAAGQAGLHPFDVGGVDALASRRSASVHASSAVSRVITWMRRP